MGILKRNIKNHWISKYGFQYSNHPVAGKSSKGFERGYYHSGDSEYLWVTVCFENRKVYLYNEYECGGFLWDGEISIPNEIEAEEEFVNWLDKELE